MRAIYLEAFQADQAEISDQEKIHHLVKVVRIKIGDEILVLNGRGTKYFCLVNEISKKKIALQVFKKKTIEQENFISVALAKTKKEALDTNIKQAIELGINQIIIFESDFSQNFEFNIERAQRLIASAIEQSNSAFAPSLLEVVNLKDLDFKEFDKVLAFISERESSDNLRLNRESKLLLIIGPEGGFSEREIDLLAEKSECIHLNTNILRATTALPAAVGYIHGKYI